jgi:hypothetical protein
MFISFFLHKYAGLLRFLGMVLEDFVPTNVEIFVK